MPFLCRFVSQFQILTPPPPPRSFLGLRVPRFRPPSLPMDLHMPLPRQQFRGPLLLPFSLQLSPACISRANDISGVEAVRFSSLRRTNKLLC